MKESKPVLLLLMVILFMACENPGWIIADLPPVAQPTTTPPVTTPPVTTQPATTQPNAVQPGVPPFVISKPVVEINGRINSFKYAGIVFKFLNNSERYVEKVIISFMLFDAKTQMSPFIGSNKFEITKYDFIAPGENKEMSISLDHYIYIAPAEPYLIDFFYISEIHYIDGAVWQDPYGKYRVRW
jgi:hypothetical protein